MDQGWATVIAAAITGVVAVIGVLVGVKFEANESEKRASRERLRQVRREAVESTYEAVIAWLYIAANNLFPADRRTLRPLPLNDRSLLPSDLMADIIGATTSFTTGPEGRGFRRTDAVVLADIEARLRDAIQQQLDRVERGLEPERFGPGEDLMHAVRAGLESAALQ